MAGGQHEPVPCHRCGILRIPNARPGSTGLCRDCLYLLTPTERKAWVS